MPSDFTAFVARVSARVAGECERRALEDEILDHLLESARELEAGGVPPEEARRQAMARFGDPDRIGKELARVHNRVPFRFFALGGLVWYALGAVFLETGAFYINQHWLVQLPLQVLGLPHWLAEVSPQIQALAQPLAPVARFMSESLSVSPWHLGAAMSAVILTPLAYGLYCGAHRFIRFIRQPEAAQAWGLLKLAWKN